MLTSRKLKGAPEATANYHMGEENYYFSQAGGAESLGSDGGALTQEHVRVHGALAAHLGFSDGQAITRQQFSNILAGKNAAGEKVTYKHKVHGIDLTFSAPKSVSVAALLTHRDPKILQAHKDAVAETMRELERACAAAQPRPGECAPTGNLAYVTALDGFNREHEPHIHTHVVVANMTLYQGRVLAIDGREIMTRGFNKMWGAIYRNKLASKLKDLGYGVTYTKKGEFRLDAVSLEVEKAFSGRRAEILEAKDRGLRDMQAWDKTRKKKDPDVKKKDVLAAWDEKLAGFKEKSPELNRSEALADRVRWYKEASWSVEARQELAGERNTGEIGRWQLAAERATQSSAAVTELEIITEYLSEVGRTEQWTTFTYAQAQAAFQEQVRAGRILATDRGYYTTWEMVRADRECVQPHKPAAELTLPRSSAEASLETYNEKARQAGRRALSERQTAAAVGILSSGRGADVVQGDAGSGKTTMLQAVNTVATNAGWEVLGVAVQGVAARNLQDESGIKSTTLASYLSQEQGAIDRGLTRKPRLVVLDEASMLGSRDGARFLGVAAQRGDKVVLVGDRNQIQSVGAGKPFERLVEAAEASQALLSLHDNYRQRSPVLRAAVDMARQGEMRRSLDLLEDKGHVIEVSDTVMRRTLIAKMYGPNTLIMAGTQDSCEDLNKRIRTSLSAKGRLETKAQREYKLSWKDGDGIRQTSYRYLAAGERVRFLQNDYRDHLDVRNGECGTIQRLGEKALEVRHDDGRLLKIDLAQYSALDYGYAVTTYKGQGQTFDRVLVEADTSIPYLQDQRNSYVQITRARDEVKIFTDDAKTLREVAGILSGKRDTLGLAPTIEEARSMEIRLGSLAKADALAERARLEAQAKISEAEAFAARSAQNIAKEYGMGNEQEEPSDQRAREENASEERREQKPPAQPTPRSGDPARGQEAERTQGPREAREASTSAVFPYDPSITGAIRDFKALFGDKPLPGSADNLRRDLRDLIAKGMSQADAVADRLKRLEFTTSQILKGIKEALEWPDAPRKLLLASLGREAEYRLEIKGQMPTKDFMRDYAALRETLPAAAEADKTPRWVPVYNEKIVESAGDATAKLKAYQALQRVDDRLRARADLSQAEQEKVAAYLGKPATAALLAQHAAKPDLVVAAAVAASQTRAMDQAGKGLDAAAREELPGAVSLAAGTTAQSAPAVTIDGRHYIAYANGHAETEKILARKVTTFEAALNARGDLSKRAKQMVAELLSKPGAVDLFQDRAGPDNVISGATIALGIRSREDACAGLSATDALMVDRCAAIAREVSKSHGRDLGRGRDHLPDQPGFEP